MSDGLDPANDRQRRYLVAADRGARPPVPPACEVLLVVLAYLLATAMFQSVITYWPDRFFVFSFYVMKETVLVALKILVALEIWRLSFSSLPEARTRVGFLLAGALAVTATAAQVLPDDLHPYDLLMGVLIPRLQAGIVLLYATIVCATSWYRVPIHPLHRAILLGFGGYLSLNALLLSILGWRNGATSTYLLISYIYGAAYILAEIWWCWAAWRPLREPTPVVLRLRPWARSW